MMRLSAVLLSLVWPLGAALAAPKVAVSIAPLYSLTKEMMVGAGSPSLLIQTPSLGHDASLTPSQVRTLKNADLLVWVGPAMEAFLVPYDVTRTDRSFPMSAQKGVKTLEGRCTHGHGHANEHDHHHVSVDPHMWLDPHNAVAFIEALAHKLSDLDPPNRAHYEANLERIRKSLEKLDKDLAHTLAPLSNTSLFVLHDTLGYFTHAYGLKDALSLSVDPDQGLSLGRLRSLEAQAAPHQGACLLGEPFWGKTHLEKLAKNLHLRPVTIDPFGYDLAQGKPLPYDEMMRALADNLRTCATQS